MDQQSHDQLTAPPGPATPEAPIPEDEVTDGAMEAMPDADDWAAGAARSAAEDGLPDYAPAG